MAAEFGLGNFLYELNVADGAANFKFRDPEDAENTAEVVVKQEDFGGHPADSRQVADIAYLQVAKALNDKRDARLRKESAAAVADKQAEDARQREAAQELFANSNDVETAPAHVEDDGTRVYNTAEVTGSDTGKTSDSESKKK